MAITRFNTDVKNISVLSNLPNEEDGLSAESLKALFDKAPADIKEYINTVLIPEIESGLDEAAMGITQGKGIGTNAISNNAVTSEKIANGAITSDKLGALAILAAAIANGAITADKLADGAISSAKINDLAITTAKLGNESVTKMKIAEHTIDSSRLSNSQGSEAVATENIRMGAVTTDKLANGAVTYEKTTGIQKKHWFREITLVSGQTTWDISVAGILSGGNNGQSVHWVPTTDAAFVLAQNSNVRAVNPNPTADRIQFKADAAPESAITLLLEVFD